MKRITIVLLSLCLSLFGTIQKEEITPLMKTKIQFVTDLLQANGADKNVLSDQIFQALDPVFDFDLMARLSLGAPQWKALSDAEKELFTSHFIDRLKRSFVAKLELYSNEVAVVKDTKDVQVGSSMRIFLLTELISKEANYQVDYKFYDAKERGWLIYDVDILGVSIVQTYRSQFEGFLKDRPFSALIGWLKEDLEP